MKRKIILAILLIGAIMLSSCTLPKGGTQMFHRYFDDDEKIANAQMDGILEAIQKHDAKTIKSFFSARSRKESKNLDRAIRELFDFYQGDFVSYDNWGGGFGGDVWENGQHQKELKSSYDVETTSQKYRFSIHLYVIDDFDPKNEGIWSLYIIKMEDDTDPSYAYGGDGEDTPGINFNVKNVLS
jgi:hypothetical protein